MEPMNLAGAFAAIDLAYPLIVLAYLWDLEYFAFMFLAMVSCYACAFVGTAAVHRAWLHYYGPGSYWPKRVDYKEMFEQRLCAYYFCQAGMLALCVGILYQAVTPDAELLAWICLAFTMVAPVFNVMFLEAVAFRKKAEYAP